MIQNVYTLLCDRDVPMALTTIPNIMSFLDSGQKLVIVDDGSLSQKSINKLTQLSGAISVLTRKEREEFICEKIIQYPALKKFREEIPLAFKLIDIPLLAQDFSPRFTYTDSDIIYLRNCKPYFNRNTNTYLRTDGVKISVRLKSVLLKYKWSIPFKFNSGYFSYDVKDYDLDFINYYVQLPDVRNILWLIEQTGWGLLFSKSGIGTCPSEEQFVCREIFDGPQSDTLAIHLIAGLKGKVYEWTQNDLEFTQLPKNPVFENGRNVNFFDWAKKSFKRISLQ